MTPTTVWLSLLHACDETLILGVFDSPDGAKRCAAARAWRADGVALTWQPNPPGGEPGECASVEFMRLFEARACKVEP